MIVVVFIDGPEQYKIMPQDHIPKGPIWVATKQVPVAISPSTYGSTPRIPIVEYVKDSEYLVDRDLIFYYRVRQAGDTTSWE